MNPLKLLVPVLLSVAFLAHGAARAEVRAESTDASVGLLYGPPPAHAALYSFSDVFRLTVAGAAMAENPLGAFRGATTQAEPALPDYPTRVVAAEAQTPGYVFSIQPIPAPERWLLVLAGLAAAAWVARRRLLFTV